MTLFLHIFVNNLCSVHNYAALVHLQVSSTTFTAQQLLLRKYKNAFRVPGLRSPSLRDKMPCLLNWSAGVGSFSQASPAHVPAEALNPDR